MKLGYGTDDDVFWKRTTSSIPVLSSSSALAGASASAGNTARGPRSTRLGGNPTPPLDAVIPPPRPETEREPKPFVRKVLATPHTANIVFDAAYVDPGPGIAVGVGGSGKAHAVAVSATPSVVLAPPPNPSGKTPNTLSAAAVTPTMFQALIGNGGTVLSGEAAAAGGLALSVPQAPNKIYPKAQSSNRVKLALKHLHKPLTSQEELDAVQGQESQGRLLQLEEAMGEISLDGLRRVPSGVEVGGALPVIVVHSPMKKSFSSDGLQLQLQPQGSGKSSPSSLMHGSPNSSSGGVLSYPLPLIKPKQ